VPGQHLLTGRTPGDYETAILRLLDDPAERARFSRAGRERVQSHHAWSHSMTRLDGIIDRCVDQFHRNQRGRSAVSTPRRSCDEPQVAAGERSAAH
jgi:hypothetical protein